MRVLFAHVNPHPRAVEAIEQYAPEAERVNVTGNPLQYWQEISARWGTGDLAIVEQDNEIHESVISQFENCPEQWCVFPYELNGGTWLDYGLGCTRFRMECMQVVPLSVIREIEHHCPECSPATDPCWKHIDCMIYWGLSEAGFQRHVHWPYVKHYHYTDDPQPPAGDVYWNRISPR